jgi:5-methylcytosine-specific restriction endonuclease McrBC regulatory subunit McrC
LDVVDNNPYLDTYKLIVELMEKLQHEVALHKTIEALPHYYEVLSGWVKSKLSQGLASTPKGKRNVNWNNLSYHRNNDAYQMLINICYLVIKGLLLTTDDGNHKMVQFVDDQQMHRLFEKFVLGY